MKIKLTHIKIHHSLVVLSMSIWIIFFFLGYFFIPEDTSYASESSKGLIKNESGTRELPKEANDPIFFISRNLAVIIIMILGTFNCGLSTVTNLIFNGFYLGGIIKQAFNAGIPLTYILLLVLPHSVFELPALWLAGAAGLKGPQVFIRYLRGGQFVTKQDINEFLILSLASIILIIIAGIIEATVTYEIAKNLMK